MMELLECLTSDDFCLRFWCIATPEALRSAVGKSDEVMQLRKALKRKEVSFDDVERFVSELMNDFRPGAKFPHDIPIAAVTVALENNPHPAARRLLGDLASLRCAEMPMSIRVAKAMAPI